MSWKLHRPKATPQSIKPYRHTHDEVGALTFPLLVLAMDVDQGPSPLMISLSREFGNGLLLAQSSDAYGEALEVLRVVFPEYRDAAIVGAELASAADLFALRREMKSGGVSTKGFYHEHGIRVDHRHGPSRSGTASQRVPHRLCVDMRVIRVNGKARVRRRAGFTRQCVQRAP